jgi:hypothetical protein
MATLISELEIDELAHGLKLIFMASSWVITYFHDTYHNPLCFHKMNLLSPAEISRFSG